MGAANSKRTRQCKMRWSEGKGHKDPLCPKLPGGCFPHYSLNLHNGNSVVTVISHITKQICRPRVWPKVTLHNDQRDCCEPKMQVPVPWEICTRVYPQTPVPQPQQVHLCPGPQAMWQFCMCPILGPWFHSLPACQTRSQGVPQLRLPPRGTKENGKTPAAFTPKEPTEQSCSMDNVNLSQ